jgi:glycosyltransferase involved in cell wall biosynthesis
MIPILYIVVPCYNEEAVLEEITSQITDLLDHLIHSKIISSNSKVLFVNDGSKDNTWSIIKKSTRNNRYVCGVNLAGNVGHQNALLSGLMTAKEHCDIAISIDADLQDDVNAIKEMVEKYNEGFDIVYGVRVKRATDTFVKKSTALAFYKLMAWMGVKSIYNHADYRLMSKRALNQLSKYRERNLFLRGIIPLIGYKTTSVYYDRAERFAGDSKYPIGKMLNFAIDGITSFSVKPVRMIFATGIVFLFIALCVFIYTIHSLITHNAVPGWSSVILSIWFVGGIILVSLGVMGEYVGKIYIEIKDRPRYNTESTIMQPEEEANK